MGIIMTTAFTLFQRAQDLVLVVLLAALPMGAIGFVANSF